MKKLYFLHCVLTSILAFFVFCNDTFGQCTASICGITNVSCNGAANGEACVEILGGTAPYNYVWSNGASTIGTAATFDFITGLSGGTGGNCLSGSCGDTVYTVTITDALGCVAVESVTINEGPTLAGTIDSIKNVSCNGDSDGIIYASACGGTCPSSSLYLWNDGSAQTTPIATGLPAGNYTVRITAFGSGCDTIYLDTVITEPPPLTATISGRPPCNNNGGYATVSPVGGASPYTYLWPTLLQTTPTATGLISNTYNVTVTDANGCTLDTSVTVTNEITANILSPTDATCIGIICDGSATVSQSGGESPFIYLWDDPAAQTDSIATGLCANTNYTVTVTDAYVCSATASFTPIALTTLTGSIIKTDVTCGENDGTATADISGGGTSPYTYSWSDGQNTATAADLSRGSYTVTITDASGCTLDTSVTVNEQCEIIPPNTFTPNGDGINDTWEIANLDLYPNCEVIVYNRWGDIVFKQVGYDTDSEWGEGSSTGKVNTLPAAVYYYVIDLKEDGSDLISGSITIIR